MYEMEVGDGMLRGIKLGVGSSGHVMDSWQRLLPLFEVGVWTIAD